MRIEKHLIGQKVIVRYMEDTDSDILGLGLGFLITSSHHITSEWRVFECVDAREATWYSENI